MIELDPETVVVSNAADLRTVITGVNTYKYIYLNDDITLTAGITVPATKTNLTIDGTYLGVRHKYTDMNSAAASDAIYVTGLGAAAPTVNITIKNVDLVGRNYYGIVCVYDSANAANTTVTYENVDYVGCQIIYNNYGITKFIDSKILIDNSTSSRQGEIGEVHKVIIGGDTTIEHTFSGFSGFHFRGGSGASLTILPDANVNIKVARNLFAGDVDLASMTFGSGSVCNITAPNGLSLGIGDRVANVLVDSAATLNVLRTSTSGSATLYVENNFTVNSGAKVLFKSTVSSTNPHLYFYYTNANLNINDPAACIFYNPGGSNFYFTGTTNINLKSYQINQYNTAPATGDIYNLPTYQWLRKNKGLIEFTGTATNSTTNITYNNLDPVADVNLPGVNALQLRTARVLSLGYLPFLKVNRVSTKSTKVKGTSVASATVKDEYQSATNYSQADATGVFAANITGTCVVGQEIVVMASNNDFLYNIAAVTIEEEGELTLYVVPTLMTFNADLPISRGPLLYGRIPENWTIQVYDSRIESSDWKLYGVVYADLISDKGHTLPDALVYVENTTITELGTTPTLVFTGENNQSEIKITDVKWDEDQGILLKIDTVPIYVGETYTTPIEWSLEE